MGYLLQAITFKCDDQKKIECLEKAFEYDMVGLTNEEFEETLAKIDPAIVEFIRVGSTAGAGLLWLSDFPKLLERAKYLQGCDSEFRGSWRFWLEYEHSYSDALGSERGFYKNGDEFEIVVAGNEYAAAFVRHLLQIAGAESINISEKDDEELDEEY